jgi:hypothetical protein
MDIHHFHGKKSHTDTCWIYTQKGYDLMVRKQVSPEHLAEKEVGKPVPEFYRQSCPMWWVHNGWVEEAQHDKGELKI